MVGTNVFVNDKPRWFDVKKYHALAGLTYQDWAYQLEIRSILSEWSITGTPLNQWPELYQQFYIGVQANPILDVPEGYPSISPYQSLKETLHVTGEYSGLHQDFVAPFTLGDASNTMKQLPIEVIDILEEEKEEYPEYSEIPVEFYRYKYQEDIIRETYLKVDLGASDEHILGDFKKYLAVVRSLYQKSREGKITRNEIQRLIQHKILPYLDLSIWSKINSKKVSNLNFSRWLYSHDRDHVSEDKIRKVTRPLALRAIESQFIQKLNSFPE